MRIVHFLTGIMFAVVYVIPLSTVRATRICDCFYYPNHLQAVRESEAIFIGEVTKVERSPESPEDLRSEVTQAITFKVVKTWKGQKVRKVRAWEDVEHTLCAKWKFEEGEKYLIYGDSRKGVLVVNGYCSRTRMIETKDAEAIKEFEQLNSPTFLRRARK